jgi:hypothetical protein
MSAVEPAHPEVQDAWEKERAVVGRDRDAASRDRPEDLIAYSTERGEHGHRSKLPASRHGDLSPRTFARQEDLQ